MAVRIKRKAGWIVTGVVLVVWMGLWMANRWAEHKIIEMLESGAENVEIEQVKAGVLSGTVIVRQLSWTRDSSYVRVRGLEVKNFSVRKFLAAHRVVIGSVVIDRPVVHLTGGYGDSAASSSPAILQRLQTAEIGKVMADSGRISFSQKDPTLSPVLISFPSLEAGDLFTDREKIKEKIPFEIGALALVTDSVFYQLDALYELSAKEVRVQEGDIRIDSFRLRPRYGKQAFQNHIPFQKTRADLTVPRIEVKGWERDEGSEDRLSFSAASLQVDSADLRLYRDKTLDENPIIKPMYSKMLRDLPFGLRIGEAVVKGGKITYEILFREGRDPGMVYLDRVEGRIRELTNSAGENGDFPPTEVRAEALLMKESKIGLDWSFFTDDPSDAFHVSGSLSRITERGMNYFLEPAFHVSAEGAVDGLQFDFQGDDLRAEGTMRMEYEKFRIMWLDKEGQPKKILSALSNLFLHNELSGPSEKEGIEVERVRTKSFWAYLWKMVQTGSLEFLL